MTNTGSLRQLAAHLPALIAIALALAGAAHGPIGQLANYHDFADHTVVFGIPHACDVLSNLGFALQVAPLVLVPIWQWLGNAANIDRFTVGVALLTYAIAKLAELNDHQIAAVTAPLTGHTLKHLLATAAAALIVARIAARGRQQESRGDQSC